MAVKKQSTPAVSALAAAILERADGAFVDVACPEWGCTIRVKTLSLLEKAAWLNGRAEHNPDGNEALSAALLVCHTACDPATGELIFTLDQAPALAGKSGVAMERLSSAALRINKLRAEDREDAAKN